MKHYLPHFFQRKRVELGTGHVIAWVIFEWKLLFSIIIYHWVTIEQNRFHSHAFPAFAFLLSGSYEEERMVNGAICRHTVTQWLRPRYLPRNYTHRILKAQPGTYTLVLVGPWIKHWYEWFEDTNVWVKYTWGRRVVSKQQSIPSELQQSGSLLQHIKAWMKAFIVKEQDACQGASTLQAMREY
jgi:hypothetical protein